MYTVHGRGADLPFFLRIGHREAFSTIFKVFGKTRPRVDKNPRPSAL